MITFRVILNKIDVNLQRVILNKIDDNLQSNIKQGR